MTELGGHAIYLDWRASNFQLSDIDFEAEYLSRNVSIIMARMKKNEDLLTLKSGSQVPVINGCCNLFHPCQALADMLTICLDRGSIKGATLCYVGVHNNVVNSLIGITAALGVHLTLVTLIAPKDAVIDHIVKRGTDHKTLTWETDLKHAVNNNEYVYTDTWVDMEFLMSLLMQKKKKSELL